MIEKRKAKKKITKKARGYVKYITHDTHTHTHTHTHAYTRTHACIDAEIRLKREFGLRGQGSITWLKRRQFTVTRFLD